MPGGLGHARFTGEERGECCSFLHRVAQRSGGGGAALQRRDGGGGRAAAHRVVRLAFLPPPLRHRRPPSYAAAFVEHAGEGAVGVLGAPSEHRLGVFQHLRRVGQGRAPSGVGGEIEGEGVAIGELDIGGVPARRTARLLVSCDGFQASAPARMSAPRQSNSSARRHASRRASRRAGTASGRGRRTGPGSACPWPRRGSGTISTPSVKARTTRPCAALALGSRTMAGM